MSGKLLSLFEEDKKEGFILTSTKTSKFDILTLWG